MNTKPWNDTRIAANNRPVRDNFLDWFGSSQVLTPSAEPLMVYHGTNQPIERFDPGRLGKNTSARSSR